MKVRLSICILAVVIITVINSCSKDKGEIQIRTCADDTTKVTYTNYVSSILNTNCTFTNGCHSSGFAVGDYTTYAGIKVKVDNGTFKTRVLVQKDMPPIYSTGPLSLDPCTLAKLQKWLDNGAPL